MLQDLLARQKAAILERWFKRVLETYAPGTAAHMQAEQDLFANPVGTALRAGLAETFEHLLRAAEPGSGGLPGPEAERGSPGPALSELLRLRSVQGFLPSAAVSFIFELKQVIREMLGEKLRQEACRAELERLASTLDGLALAAFDAYMRFREELYELRVREALGHRDAAFRMLGRTTRQAQKA